MKRKLLVFVLVFMLVPFAYAVAFSDVASSDPDYVAVSDIVSRGIAAGYGNGTFGADGLVTRAEATKFIARTVGLDCSAYTNTEPDFTDTASAYGLKQYIACFKAKGFASGYGDGRFGPQNEVLGPEFLKMLYKAARRVNEADFDNPNFTVIYNNLHDTSLTLYVYMAIGDGVFPPATNDRMIEIRSLLRRDVARYLHNFIDYVEANSPEGTYQITSLEYADELKEAIEEYYPERDIDDWEIVVYQITDTHAHASLMNPDPDFPGIGMFLVKTAETWEAVLTTGGDDYSCEEIAPYDFPASMIGQCYDSATHEIILR